MLVYFAPGLRGSSYSARNTTPTMLPLVSTVTIGNVSFSGQFGVGGGGPKYLTTFARPASSAPTESSLEARIAQLESDVVHLREDVADIKTDVRALRDKIDAIKDTIANAKVWALLLYAALATGVFGTMARGFGWL